MTLPAITREFLREQSHGSECLALSSGGVTWRVQGWVRHDRMTRWLDRGLRKGDRLGIAVVLVHVASGRIIHRNTCAEAATVEAAPA